MPVKGFYFDVLPVGKGKVLLFVLWKEKMAAWEGEGRWSEKRQRWEVRWPEKPTAAVATERAGLGAEPFTAYARDKTWFFLTRSGQLFAAPEGSGPDRVASRAWVDSRLPVRAVVTDTAADKTFLFTRRAGVVLKPGQATPEDQQDLYFELATGAKPNRYDRKALDPPPDDDPVGSVLPYARLVLGEKRNERPR